MFMVYYESIKIILKKERKKEENFEGVNFRKVNYFLVYVRSTCKKVKFIKEHTAATSSETRDVFCI